MGKLEKNCTTSKAREKRPGDEVVLSVHILLILEDELFIELSTTSSVKAAFCLPGTALVPNQFMWDRVISSGRKNVLRKLLRIPYQRLKAGFSMC